MGRIHRYGQEKDCLIINFVSTNTREGRVLSKLFERLKSIEEDLDPKRTGKIFNVLGDVFPANQLERLLREMYARSQTEDAIKDRIVEQVDVERFRKITHSALEGLAKRELNLAAIVGKSAEAKERRLVPEVVEDFFIQAAPYTGIYPKLPAGSGKTGQLSAKRVYRVGKVPRNLWPVGERLEPRFGRLGHEYKVVAFDKAALVDDPTLEWVTPGHPLFEVVRTDILDQVQGDLNRGALFYDLDRDKAARLDVFSASVRDGRGGLLHKRLFVMETALDGTISLRQPAIFLDLQPAPAGMTLPDELARQVSGLPPIGEVETALVSRALQPFLDNIAEERRQQVEVVSRHLEISLNALIDRAQNQYAALDEQRRGGSDALGLDGRLKMMEDRLDELNARLDHRRAELRQERHCTIADVQHIGRAWVLPHPERLSPGIASMVRDEEVERIAVQEAIRYETERGWQVQSVEAENRGFDLISRRISPTDGAAVELRFIEVKGRAGVGEVALSPNEYKTAGRLRDDYWLYVVYNCASTPELHPIHDPARLDWKSIVKVEHYQIGPQQVLDPSNHLPDRRGHHASVS
jgi:hypothetical protein